MIGIMVGTLIAAVAFAIPVFTDASAIWLFWVGMGVVALSLVAGVVLRNMGYGQKSVSSR